MKEGGSRKEGRRKIEKKEEERFYLYTGAPDLPQGYTKPPFILI